MSWTTATPANTSRATLIVDVDIYETSAGWEFDWSANHDVGIVVAKGGPVANLYTYEGAQSDSGLHAPFNSNSGSWYGLSHISFCTSTSDDTLRARMTRRRGQMTRLPARMPPLR